MAIRVSHKRMDFLCSRLAAACRNREYPYNLPGVEPPQVLLPESMVRGSREHAFFLFVLCYWMRGGTESDTAISLLTKLYEFDEKLFDAYGVQKYTADDLEELLRDVGLGFDKRGNAERWIINAKHLASRFGGDPRLIFHDFGKLPEERKWEVAVKRIANKGDRGRKGGFEGFQLKMVSMLIYFLMDQGMIERFDFPVPVDFHVARMMVQQGVVKLEPGVKYTGKKLDEVLDRIRYLTYHWAKKNGISSIMLCDALWLFSRTMCSETPIMKTTVGKRNGRRTTITEERVTWTKSTIRTYEQVCGACPVAKNCDCLVRSAYWYNHGELRPSPKYDFPQSNLLSTDDHRNILSKPQRNRHRQAQVKVSRNVPKDHDAQQLDLETA